MGPRKAKSMRDLIALVAGLPLLATSFVIVIATSTPSEAQSAPRWTNAQFFNQCVTDEGYGRTLVCNYSGGTN